MSFKNFMIIYYNTKAVYESLKNEHLGLRVSAMAVVK